MKRAALPTRIATLAVLRRNFSCVIAGLAIVCTPVAIGAEAETDTMDKGAVQLELKLASTRDAPSGLRQRATPVLARIGIADNLELRLATDGQITDSSGPLRVKGWGDAELGLRWRTATTSEAVAGQAWQIELGLASGSRSFRADGASYALRYTIDWMLPGDIVLGLQPALVSARNGAGERYVAPAFAATLSKNWTKRVKTVAELVATQLARTDDGGRIATANLGLVIALTDTLEFESVLQRGLTRETPRIALELGFNQRF